MAFIAVLATGKRAWEWKRRDRHHAHGLSEKRERTDFKTKSDMLTRLSIGSRLRDRATR